MSEDKLNAAAAKGARANRLLSDPIFTETLDTLEAAYIKKWKDSKARDDDGRQRLWQAVQILGIVKSHIKQIESDGKIAQAEMSKLTKG